LLNGFLYVAMILRIRPNKA